MIYEAKTVCLCFCYIFICRSCLPLPQGCHAMAKNAEIQVEYLRHRIYTRRFIDNYNIHVFQKAHEHAGLTFHRGFTVTRAQGYTTEDNIRRDSDAVGLGPACMIR